MNLQDDKEKEENSEQDVDDLVVAARKAVVTIDQSHGRTMIMVTIYSTVYFPDRCRRL